jgi:hypothetical protein
MLLGLLTLVIILGAMVGKKTLGYSDRSGIGFLVLALVVTMGASVYYYSDYGLATSVEDLEETKEGAQVYVVIHKSAAYKEPDINSVISGSYSAGTELIIEDPDKHKYFYEVRQANGELRYVLKVNLERKDY